ncbi:hypothetical protein ABTO68_19305, partial [Acinetobacter baumannii]
LATIINHPDLFGELAEPLGLLPFGDPELEKLRWAVIECLSDEANRDSTLDADALCRHLSSAGHETMVGALLGESTYVHAGFARPEASTE